MGVSTATHTPEGIMPEPQRNPDMNENETRRASEEADIDALRALTTQQLLDEVEALNEEIEYGGRSVAATYQIALTRRVLTERRKA